MPGVYLSWPFCAQKCTYCNFASGVFPRALESSYLDALLRELRSTAWPWTPSTLYLGGGTPGSMDLDALQRLLESLPGRPWLEATLEAAPGAISREQVRAWRRSGIQRVSLGVQSFVDAELRRTGRTHDAAAVARDVALLRDEGLPEINIDLIAGLPGQTAAGWQTSLDCLARLAPPHVSVYMLEVDDDSRLGRELILGNSRYGAKDVPPEEAIADFYELAVAALTARGLERYEISNFALPGHESRHNLKYWRREPYLGFGAYAHSFDGRLRWQNVEDPAAYATSENPRLPSTPANASEERFFVGLRLAEGVEPSPAEWDLWRDPLSRLLSQGLLERSGPRVRLTRRGVMVSNEVFAEFLLPA